MGTFGVEVRVGLRSDACQWGGAGVGVMMFLLLAAALVAAFLVIRVVCLLPLVSTGPMMSPGALWKWWTALDIRF